MGIKYVSCWVGGYKLRIMLGGWVLSTYHVGWVGIKYVSCLVGGYKVRIMLGGWV